MIWLHVCVQPAKHRYDAFQGTVYSSQGQSALSQTPSSWPSAGPCCPCGVSSSSASLNAAMGAGFRVFFAKKPGASANCLRRRHNRIDQDKRRTLERKQHMIKSREHKCILQQQQHDITKLLQAYYSCKIYQVPVRAAHCEADLQSVWTLQSKGVFFWFVGEGGRNYTNSHTAHDGFTRVSKTKSVVLFGHTWIWDFL